MNRIIILLLVCFLFGCVEQTNPSNYNKTRGDEFKQTLFSEIEIEDCQYFYRKSGSTFGLSHKGNCTNPIHCQNQN